MCHVQFEPYTVNHVLLLYWVLANSFFLENFFHLCCDSSGFRCMILMVCDKEGWPLFFLPTCSVFFFFVFHFNSSMRNHRYSMLAEWAGNDFHVLKVMRSSSETFCSLWHFWQYQTFIYLSLFQEQILFWHMLVLLIYDVLFPSISCPTIHPP